MDATWIIAPCQRNRDSRLFEKSNWDAQLDALNEADPSGESFEVVREGNPFCGWAEYVKVAPALAHVVETLRERLEGYPVLNEDDFSNREWDLVCRTWDVSKRERVQICRWAKVSPVEALRSVGNLSDRLIEYLRREN